MPLVRPTLPRLAALLAVLAACTSGCSLGLSVAGNGEQARVPRPIRGFSKVVLSAPIDARIREGTDYDVVVWIDSNLEGLLTTTVTGDTLVIDTAEPIDPLVQATIDIALPRLDAFTIDGSGDARIAGAPAHPLVQLSIHGSGDIAYSGGADVVQASISGSGDIHLTGEARLVSAEINGSGSIDARAMPANDGRFEISGSGDILANLRGGDVSCEISGSGDIRWLGTARVTSLEVSGSGSVGALDAAASPP
jgi:hypothetical protein